MKQYFAFTRLNFILLAVAMAVVVVGMILMSGDGSTKEAFNPDIFSATRIKVAPLVCLIGYVLMIVAIMFPSKHYQEIDDEPGIQTNSVPMFSRPFSFKGRIGRSEFGISFIIYFGINLLTRISDLDGFSAIILLPIYIALLWFFLAQTCKRYHDRGKSGSTFILLLIPIYNLYETFMLLFADGDVGDNEYGVDPKGRTQNKKNLHNNIKRR